MSKELINISDDLSLSFDESSSTIALYDIRAYSPRLIITLSIGEMNAIYNLYQDGFCAICLDAIPSESKLCCDCLYQISNYHLNHHACYK